MQMGKWHHPFWDPGVRLDVISPRKAGYCLHFAQKVKKCFCFCYRGYPFSYYFLVPDFLIGPKIVGHGKFAVTDFLVTNLLVTHFLVTEFLFVPYSLNLSVKEKLVTEMSFQKIMHYSLKINSH